jgi:L-iditol 2-dehydrogenase
VGVCGSDVTYFANGRIGDQVIKSPMPLGHEPAGEIDEVCKGVKRLKVGMRVFVEPAVHCGECECCRAGLPNLCHKILFLGTPPIPGAFREFVTCPARNALPIPDHVSFEEAAMMEPYMVAMTSVETLAKARAGQTAAVFGCGTIGLSHVIAARLAGARVLAATDRIDGRLALAREFGAENIINVSKGIDVSAAVLQLTGGRGVDIAFECAGSPDAVNDAIKSAARAGQVVICGIPHEETIPIDIHNARRKELTILNVRRSRADHHEAFRLLAEGKLPLKRFVTHRLGLEQTKEALELASSYRDGVIKAMIMP